MRTFTLLFSALVIATSAQAQTVATFDTLSLAGLDTQYVNYSVPGTDVGFNNGLAHFPCIYDTSSFGNYWASGFVYSNWTDSSTNPGYGGDSVFYLDASRQAAAKTGVGYAGSAKYAVAYCNNPVTFAVAPINLQLTGSAIGHSVAGFFATNSCYAYSSMKYGDGFDTAFHTGDWFLLTVKGFRGGTLTADSVNFYLADYRFTDTAMDYIVNTWEWVNLLPLGHVDSIQFALSSSNTTGGSMDVPSYFCMDNFTTNETDEAVPKVNSSSIAKVYPNPATNLLYVDISDNTVQQVTISDMAGNLLNVYNAASHLEINTSSLPAGTYLLQLTGNGKNAATRFVKK